MNRVVEQMLQRVPQSNTGESSQALREVMQEIALVGLYRLNFFAKAAFYGGTCLRIFHNLPRFSEDLDFFSLLESAIQPSLSIPSCRDWKRNLLPWASAWKYVSRKKPLRAPLFLPFKKHKPPLFSWLLVDCRCSRSIWKLTLNHR